MIDSTAGLAPDDPDHPDQLKARVAALEAALGQNDSRLAMTFGLSRRLGNLLGLLMQMPAVDAKTIEEHIGIVTDAKIAVLRLRRRMVCFGVDIKGRRGFGYWVTDEDKARVRELVDGQ